MASPRTGKGRGRARAPGVPRAPRSSVLPPLYARWMDELLGGPIPDETEATCADCAMCDDPQRPTPGGYFFDRTTKCCTYLPELPSFLVGAILDDEQASRDSVRARLRAGGAVTPFGLGQPSHYRLIFQNTITGFGHSQALRCPHYLEEGGGRCGVWRHREATCATWFCKHVRGALGKSFWNRLHLLLGEIERGLSRACLLEADLGADALRELFPVTSPREQTEAIGAADLDGKVDPGRYALAWGRWLGREEELYRRAADTVAALSWADVVRRCGAEVSVHAAIVKELHGRLAASPVAGRLTLGPMTILGVSPEKARIQTYSFLDPLDVPRRMWDVLPLFDGRPVEEVQRDVEGRIGERLLPAAIAKLVDFQVLRPCDAPTLDPSPPAVVRPGLTPAR